MTRAALALLMSALLCGPAFADAAPQIARIKEGWHRLCPKCAPKKEPVPLPISRPKPDLRSSAPPAPAASENSRPHSRDVKAKVAEPDSRQAPLPKPAQQKAKQKEVVRHQLEPGPHKTQPASADQERPARATCTPITVDCAQVCRYAYLGEAGGEALGVAWGYCRPTPAQRREGKACVRQQCPQWLTR